MNLAIPVLMATSGIALLAESGWPSLLTYILLICGLVLAAWGASKLA